MAISQRFLHANDKAGTYPPSYYCATANKQLDFPKLEGESSCDVCVIGAGYAGLSSALHLAERGYKVQVLEAHRVGWGASGRNGGQLGSGQRMDQDDLETLVGQTRARELWDLSEAAKSLTKNLIDKHKIHCDLKPGILHADHKQSYVSHSKAYAEKLAKNYDYEQIRFVDNAEIQEMLDTQAYHGGTLDRGAAHLHPLNFVLGLAQACVSAGVEIFENSEVLEIQKGEPALLKLAKAQVRARYVIFACNGYIDTLEPKVAARVMPINNYIIATEPLGEDMAKSLIRDDVAVADSRFVVNYFRLSADNRLLFGGGESYSFQFPDDIKAFVRKPMLEVYPQLQETQIDFAWGGTLGITLNRMPYFAKLSPNMLNASGFSGHGVAMATFAGKLMAEAIDGQASRFDVMENFPTRAFPGGRHLRWPLMVLGMLYYSLRDRF
ncbi:Gamma-glutamylputrescine oxidoreductase [Pseudovibrio axinellae]|uniref:Gamma-glutamylputrescine oxidoreductase n=1 Tax=Pseudovibrio axinellae TaxID=989403 RepID=A0A165T537_9HYPH|nr:FAD-binding oxidoreductase [Pseudovibrio axinellae]KZL05444.1 Gamma-glutamylputrescine oxidoreductase [Pseudovibrio axinellae]SEP98951.1 gamma-glutamylputrescine oxidase [Pseudovibrio axinellae]